MAYGAPSRETFVLGTIRQDESAPGGIPALKFHSHDIVTSYNVPGTTKQCAELNANSVIGDRPKLELIYQYATNDGLHSMS